MKWTNDQIEKLQELCFEGKSNAQLAQHFNVPVTEIYAKRSHLGITIDKVKAAKDAPEDRDARVLSEKQHLVKAMETVIMFADKTVTGLELSEDGNTVLIKYGQWGKKVDIECDSHLAIIFDVARKCLY